jgi:hypothetical protein
VALVRARPSLFAATLTAGLALGLRAQSAPAAVIVRGDSIEVTFPPLALSETGCSYIDSTGPTAGRRRIFWMASSTFADSKYPMNHFMSAFVNFYLPQSAEITRERLDSALAVERFAVDESAGEPPMTRQVYSPDGSRAELAGSQMHFTIHGKEAVAAFLSPKVDSVSLLWCQRDQVLSFVIVPLQRR